jgi:hypothetical protein
VPGVSSATEPNRQGILGVWKIFSADETAGVGIDRQTPVAEGIGIGPETRFTGRINRITLDVGPAR